MSGQAIARNTILNLLGQGAPMLVAIFAIPVLTRELGASRFGVLSLAWMMIGYFSLFDFGLGLALTKLVAEKLGGEREKEVPGLVWTALLLMLALGVVGALVFAVLSPWLVGRVLNIPGALRAETLPAFYLLALSLPWVITTAGFRGLLEAYQRFDLVNAIRVPMGILTFCGPLFVLPFSSSLVAVVAVLAALRLAGWIVHLGCCFRAFPQLWHTVALRKTAMRSLLGFGSWMSVSNIISPLMVYFDRFMIAALLSVSAVAYYVAPYELVLRLLLIPLALVGVLFPAFAAGFVRDRQRTALLFDRAVRVIYVVMFPLVLALVALAHPGLDLWLGSDFARNGTRVLQWLAVGILFNSLAQVPFATIQSAGRPDLTAKLHLAELPLYLLTLWLLVRSSGIEGAAMAWVARVVVDTIALFLLSARFLPGGRLILLRTGLMLAATLPALPISALAEGATTKGAVLFGVLIAFGGFAWFRIVSPEERALLVRSGLRPRERSPAESAG